MLYDKVLYYEVENFVIWGDYRGATSSYKKKKRK